MHMQQNNLTLDLRSYSAETDNHLHDYHQLVLPVSGQLDISVGRQSGRVDSERAAIISAGQEHGFSGSEDNCFVVADIPGQLAPEFEQVPAFIHLSPAIIQYVRLLQQRRWRKTSVITMYLR